MVNIFVLKNAAIAKKATPTLSRELFRDLGEREREEERERECGRHSNIRVKKSARALIEKNVMRSRALCNRVAGFKAADHFLADDCLRAPKIPRQSDLPRANKSARDCFFSISRLTATEMHRELATFRRHC